MSVEPASPTTAVLIHADTIEGPGRWVVDVWQASDSSPVVLVITVRRGGATLPTAEPGWWRRSGEPQCNARRRDGAAGPPQDRGGEPTHPDPGACGGGAASPARDVGTGGGWTSDYLRQPVGRSAESLQRASHVP